MNMINKLKIKTKIMLALGGAALLCILFSAIIILEALSIKNSFGDADVILITTGIFMCIMPIICITLGLLLSGNISKPLKFLAECISGIAESGNIFLDDNAYKQTKTLNKRVDDIGGISRSVGDMLAMFREKIKSLGNIRDGNLTAEIGRRSDKDTIGAALVSMVKSLSGMFADIQVASQSVSDGSVRMDSEARQLADGTAEQAESVQSLSITIAGVAEQTARNAGMAAQSAQLSRSVKQLAEKGGSQMSEMIKAVRDINEASTSISRVIKVIDDIAFQTNILALNAAVEAARAGQHGKGFAVVAEEVRNLASKSAEAAKNTNSMIADSMTKAELGSRIAEDTAQSFTEIIASITETADLAGKIAELSDKQAGIIADVNTSIDKISDSVRRNSLTAEESARDSQEVSRQSTLLRESLGRFKIN